MRQYGVSPGRRVLSACCSEHAGSSKSCRGWPRGPSNKRGAVSVRRHPGDAPKPALPLAEPSPARAGLRVSSVAVSDECPSLALAGNVRRQSISRLIRQEAAPGPVQVSCALLATPVSRNHLVVVIANQLAIQGAQFAPTHLWRSAR